MVETRIDAETGDWKIIAPRRASRPVDHPGTPAGCPFCWGNESMTPPEVLRIPTGSDAWQIRVVPNLFALVDTADAERPRTTPRPDALPFTGQHEVVIESGRHDWDLRSAHPDEVVAVLSAIRQRCLALGRRRPAAIVAFRNYGVRAGSSLSHPHSQIVALDQAPPDLVRRWRSARAHHEETGRRLHDDVAEAERREGTRVVSDADGVLVFQPYAASTPHETTLLPDDAGADLAGAPDRALRATGEALHRVLGGLATVLDDPAYNLVVHAGPADDPTARDWYRWHITLYPRVTTIGGLEYATGVDVSPAAPEQTAPALRDALARG